MTRPICSTGSRRRRNVRAAATTARNVRRSARTVARWSTPSVGFIRPHGQSPYGLHAAPPSRCLVQSSGGSIGSVTRVAAVDLGTNSTRLLVADIQDGRIRDLERETRVTRLGEGVDGRRRLLPLPIARVRNVLSDYRRIAETLGVERTLAIGTSAVRDAENGEAFLGEIEWSYGFRSEEHTSELQSPD